MNTTPPQRRSKPRLRRAIAAIFAVAILVVAVGQASASTTTTTTTSSGKSSIQTMKVSW